jgi:signal transduction histidine kinase/ActR/RegA family two-component response regulator
MWALSDASGSPAGVAVKVADTTETEVFHQNSADMNQALMLASVRQHELTEVADKLNTKLQEEIGERKRTERFLQDARDQMEMRVTERTSELQQAYEALKHEIDERGKAEAQLQQAQKIEALGTLSGGIAHDFNNILAAIMGFTELVSDRVPQGSREAHQLERVMEASFRGRDLVRQMLSFSRKVEQEKKPLRISSITKETVKLIRAAIPATISIRVKTKSESGLILADPTQMQQIIMNLCTNAAYAMREKGGTLNIRLSDHTVSPSNDDPDGIKPGLYVKLTVRDTGIGIAPDIKDKIFDPFFTTKKVGEGTGLGLSVVHGIVKHSNGYITVESKPGKGSVFTVYFPQITGELVTDAISDDRIPTGSERIFLIDDEEALVEMGEDILAELGYDVTSRMNGREALALFRLDPSRFDLVITDQTMPEMAGFELVKEMLALRADMPIIMCTGFSHVVDADKAKAAGIRAFAMKPLTKREIAKTIRKVLDEHTFV